MNLHFAPVHMFSRESFVKFESYDSVAIILGLNKMIIAELFINRAQILVSCVIKWPDDYKYLRMIDKVGSELISDHVAAYCCIQILQKCTCLLRKYLLQQTVYDQ